MCAPMDRCRALLSYSSIETNILFLGLMNSKTGHISQKASLNQYGKLNVTWKFFQEVS